MRYEVICGNIGTVYHGNDGRTATRVFNTYRELSLSGIGRAGNEAVTLFDNGEIAAELLPSIEESEGQHGR